MRRPIDFVYINATDDEPARDVLTGHLREWDEEFCRLREALILARNDLRVAYQEIERELDACSMFANNHGAD
jgi:hypothetical protein